MNIPCPLAITCEGSDWPILNLSSESPDHILFGSPVPPPLPCVILDCPPQVYTAKDCFGVVYSATSQQEADLLALMHSVNCDTPPFTCTNEPQTATAYCADGTAVSYTTPAGMFAGPTTGTYAACVAAANAQALAYAQQKASEMAPTECVQNQIRCLISTTSPLPDGQIGSAYSQTIIGFITGMSSVFSIQGGSLPPGLHMDSHGNITGTPTTAGTYSFMVELSSTAAQAPSVSMSGEVVIVTDPVFGTILSNDMQFTFVCTNLTPGVIYLITYSYIPPGGSSSSSVTQWFLATSGTETVKSPLFPNTGIGYASGSNPTIAAGDPPTASTPTVTTSSSTFGAGWLRFTCGNLSVGDSYTIALSCYSATFVATNTTMVRDEFVSPCTATAATITLVPQPPPTPHVAMSETVPPSTDKDFLCTDILVGYKYKISVSSSLFSNPIDLMTFTSTSTAMTITISVLGLGTVSNPSIVYVP